MLQFCTPELLDCVFSHVGYDNIIVDNKNLSKNTWEITDLIQAEQEELLDNLKVIFVFVELGGVLINEGKEVPYSTLFFLINKNEPNIVLQYWLNNELNDVKPLYNLGEIEIPEIMPRFICTPISDNAFLVEQWHKGVYVSMKEIYPTRELCEKRVQELNEIFDANDWDDPVFPDRFIEIEDIQPENANTMEITRLKIVKP